MFKITKLQNYDYNENVSDQYQICISSSHHLPVITDIMEYIIGYLQKNKPKVSLLKYAFLLKVTNLVRYVTFVCYDYLHIL